MKQAIGLLGLALRARKLTLGASALDKVKHQQTYLIILSDEIGENMKKKYYDKCHYYHKDIVVMPQADIDLALNKSNVKAIAVMDKGFANKLSSFMKG